MCSPLVVYQKYLWLTSKVSAFKNRCDFHESAPLCFSPQIWGEKQRGAIQGGDPNHTEVGFGLIFNMSYVPKVMGRMLSIDH